MSKFKKKLGRRIMAVALSVAMIMSNMTVYADELTSETQVESSVEETNDDAESTEAVEDVVNEEEKETLSTKETVVSEKEDEDAASEDADDKASEKVDKVSEKKDSETKDEEKKTAGVDNKELNSALISGEVYSFINKHNPATSFDDSSLSNFEFNGFGTSISNDHGPHSTEAGATITFIVPGSEADKDKVDIEVTTCKHGSGKPTAKVGTESLDNVTEEGAENDGKDEAPKYIVHDVIGASKVTLTFPNAVYIHSIKATIQPKGETRTITLASEIGNATITQGEVTSAIATSTVNMEKVATVDAAEGYRLTGWKVTYENSGETKEVTVTKAAGKYSFEMPDANVTVTPVISAIGTFTSTKFFQKYQDLKHAKNDPVDDIDGLTVIKGIFYNDGSHGLGVSNGGQMKLYLAEGKHDITVWGCSAYGAKENTTMTASTASGELTVATEPKVEHGGETPPRFTVLNAEGEVTLTFGGGSSYVHNIDIEASTGKHFITVTDDGNGEASADKRMEVKDKTVTLTAVPAGGYRFKEWQIIKPTEENALTITPDANDANVATFVMLDKDVEIKATFEAVGASHSITLETTVEHGSVEEVENASMTAVEGATVNLGDIAKVTPAEGYELKEWKVTYTKTDGTKADVEVKKEDKAYSFTMPDADVTITPVFKEKEVTYFATTYFNKRVKDGLSTAGAPVDDVNGLEVLTEGTVKFKYHGDQHGLDVGDAKIKLTLTPNKIYDLTIWECQHGSKNIEATSGGQPVDVTKETVNNDDPDDPQKGETNVGKFTILNVQNEVTLTFKGGQSYVHSIILTESSGAEKYKVTVTDDGHGSATADNALAEAGTEITLTATPDNHYKFKEWQVISGDVTIENDKFTMPASAVEIKAVFELSTRREWDFANDEGLKGANGKEIIDTTESVEGLSIDATAEGSGWDSTGTGTDGALAKNKTKITVPVDGTIFKVAVSAENASYTVDGIAAEAAEQTFDCKSSDEKVVIEMTADNHIKAINITPIYYVKAGTYNFASAIKELKLDGFTFDKFEHKLNSHGCETTGDNASITLNLSGKANVVVTGCRYGVNTGVTMTASSGEVTKAIIDEGGADAPEFSVRKTDAGELTLTFSTGEGTLWIHTISVEYLPEDVPDVYTEGIDVWDFGAEQLQSTDAVKYNNKLTKDIINGWYSDIAPGTSGVTIPSFEVKDEAGHIDFMFNDGGYTGDKGHRLRTENTELTRYDSKTLKIGDTIYKGYLYSNKGPEKGVYVGVKLNVGDIMTAVVSSNGNAYTITVEDPDGGVQNFARPKGPSIITYYATKSGIHKIYNGTDEKLVVGRVTRQHSKVVKVSGSVTRKDGVNGELTLAFTCKESGRVDNVTVAEDGSYSVDLFENYHYNVVVSPKIYVIEEGADLALGAANETQTQTHNITVGAVTLRALSGAIVGLDDTAMNNLQISFEKPEEKIYLPEIEVDKAAKTYSALLESGVEYLLVTEGINDYELDDRANNNSDRFRFVSDVAGRNITYTKKPVYKITIEPEGATLENLANATFTFTNLNEEGYVYSFTGAENIALRDGTYSVVVTDSGVYRQKLTTNLVVDGSDVTKKIAFDSTPVTKWDFVKAELYDEGKFVKNPCDGLSYSGEGTWKHHGDEYGSQLGNIVISVPVVGSGKVAVEVGYTWDIASGDVTDAATSNSGKKTIEIPYDNTVNKVDITVGGSTTTYIKTIEVIESFEYKATVTVGKDKDYQTINDALDAVRKMDRTAEQAVTIMIDPGDYEEMLVINTSNVKLVNAAGENASIGLRNKGVDIDPNAVRITSYYGHGYSYYSMGDDCKWNADVLETNKVNGYESYTNPGSGTTNGSYWNATVVITASNVSAEGIIFENSFNQYISKKAVEDVIVKTSSAKEGVVPRASMAYGDTTVQQKSYVERAAALAIYDNCAKISFDNCKFVGRQDTLYGGVGTTAAFYNCAVYGGTDYIFGGMKAVFAKCELVFNTSDEDKSDVGYITAAQQKSGHGYLMYNCHVTSTMPGVDTASQYTSKPGYLGRPWQAHTGEAVFYKTIIDEADAQWSTAEGEKLSLITPAGWDKTLSDISELSQEYGTFELSGVDNSTKRVDWAKVLTEEKLVSGEAITVETFLGDWNAFAGKDMTIALPSDENAPAPAQPKAIVSPKAEKDDEVIKEGTIVLVSEMGAKVYYNVNADSNPTETPEMLYKGAINVTDENIKDNAITIKAIAVKYGKTSDVATFNFKVVEAPAPAQPVLTPASNTDVLLGSSIKMSAPYGAKIYYNVNKEAAPTQQDELYTGKLGAKITLDMVNKDDSTVKIQAVAVMTGKASEVTTATYNVIVNKPIANLRNGYQFPDGGGKVKFTADEDVTILYTMGATAADAADPTIPESNPMVYDKEGSGIAVTQDATIKAVAKRGSKYSAVVTLEYLVPLSMPIAIPESGSVLPKNMRTVLLTADKGTTIYYTIGADSDPIKDTETRKTYDPAQGIEVTENNTIIKAVAVKDERQSTIAAFTYTISDEIFPQAETPTVTTVNGEAITENTAVVEEGKDVVIKLATATEGAEIHYTTDNSRPTASSDKYNDETGITISKIAEDTVVKAIAVKQDCLDSEPLTITIKVKKQGGGDEPGQDPDITIDDKAGIEIVGLESEYYYTGAAITPDFDVVDNGIKENGNPRVLTVGIDYTVKYKNNKKEGAIATVTVVGKGNYIGKTVEETFTVKPLPVIDEEKLADLKGAKIKKIDPQPYDGTAQYPDIILTPKNGDPVTYKYNTATKQYLKEDQTTDVIVTISGNKNKGTATILVTGKTVNKKKTSVKATFKITPVDLSQAAVQFVGEEEGKGFTAPYAVKGAMPKVTVKYTFAGKDGAPDRTVSLVNGKDYTLKYSGNKKVDTAGRVTGKVIITGKGNFTKKAPEKTFAVERLDMKDTKLVAAEVYEGVRASKVKAVVVDANGDALKASQYTVTAYTDKGCTPGSEYTGDERGKCKLGDVIYLQATAKDTKNLVEGSITPEPLEVKVGANIAKAKIKLNVKSKAYTGTYVQLQEEDLDVTMKVKGVKDPIKLKLKPAVPVEGEKYDYEIISYSNNINKGNASVVIRGIGDYSGTKTIKFKIAAKEMKKTTKPTN